jgi:hypothetical protein
MIQRAAGQRKSIIFDLYYPTTDPAQWDSHVPEQLLRRVPGFKPGVPLFNGLHVFPLVPRTHHELFQPWMQPYKQAERAIYNGGYVAMICNDKDSAGGIIKIACVRPEFQVVLCSNPVDRLAMTQAPTESDRNRWSFPKSMFDGQWHNSNVFDTTSPLHSPQDAGILIFLVGPPAPAQAALAGTKAGYVETWLTVALDGYNQQLLFTCDELALLGPTTGLDSTASIASGQVQPTTVNVPTVPQETRVARLCERPVLEKWHAPTLRFIANPRIPRALAHRHMNKLLSEVHTAAPAVVGSFIDFATAAMQTPEYVTRHMEHIWMKAHEGP